MIEDVLVRLDKCFFLAGFTIMDFMSNKETSIMLARPFLVTGRLEFDIEKGELIMRVIDQ